MMYKTHIVAAKGTAMTAIAIKLITGEIQSNVLLNLGKLPEIAVQCAIIYVGICWGSEYPDTDLINSRASNSNFINKLIAKYNHSRHLFHRSPQTHSIDICFVQCLALYIVLMLLLGLSKEFFLTKPAIVALIGLFDKYLYLFIWSVFVGNVCHIVADFFTQEGAYIIHCLPKFRLVPANVSIFGYKPFKDFFSTGDDSAWELFVRKMCGVYFKATCVVCLILVFLPVNNIMAFIK